MSDSLLLLHSCTLHRPLRRCALPLLLWCGLLLGPAGHAADDSGQVLLSGGGVTVTTADVLADLDLRQTSPKDRALLFSDADVLRTVVDRIYLRRALAAQGERHHVDDDPQVRYQLLTLREGVLADAEVVRLQKGAMLDPALVEKLASARFKAEPGRFASPALTRASHILIKGKDASAHNKAQELLAQLKAGAKFEDLAREHSADPGSAARGGDLGLFAKGRMVPEFDAAVAQLKNPGDLSGVVESPFGLHIIRLDERQAGAAKRYEEVHDALVAEITAEAQGKARQEAIEALRAQARGDATLLDSFMAEQKAKLPAPSLSN